MNILCNHKMCVSSKTITRRIKFKQTSYKENFIRKFQKKKTEDFKKHYEKLK